MFGWLFRNATVMKPGAMPLYFHNTLGNKREEFKPRGGVVKMYNCGPTVYDVQQIGNLSSSGGVFGDTVRRVLEYNGYSVKQVINITDFGHLVSDADEGEDKMTKGLKREGMDLTLENMKKLADRYTSMFMRDIAALNVVVDKIEFPRASAYIPAQIALIKTLIEKGYAYKIKDGLYFNTALFPQYGALGGISKERQEDGARIAANPEKKNSADFALWKLNDAVGWDSPWGKGFPGWHIECSAMIRSILGEQIDIHTGGPEHVAIHHNNEIAQSEAASGKSPFARYWLHRAHIQLEGHKIAKSLGNTVYLKDVIDRGFDPLALRYWFLTAHYRSHANFTWEALGGAATALRRLHQTFSAIADTNGAIPRLWQSKFHERINDDLDTPGAIAVMWEMLKDEKVAPADKKATLLDFDRVLGIGLVGHSGATAISIPGDVQKLVEEREVARKEKKWKRADELRAKIKAKGFEIEDAKNGARLSPISKQS
jgi:cysteinyl-tRNA synthetase